MQGAFSIEFFTVIIQFNVINKNCDAKYSDQHIATCGNVHKYQT